MPASRRTCTTSTRTCTAESPDRDLDTLDPYWTVFPSLRRRLFVANGRPGYSDARVEAQQLKTTILRSAEFTSFEQRVAAIFDAWHETHGQLLRGLEVGTLPKMVIHDLAEDLLARFSDLPLLDRYDVYQRLMDYWDAEMQDDVSLIASPSLTGLEPPGHDFG